jgi:hypothetical protein
LAIDHPKFLKSTERPLLEAVYELLGEYGSSLITAPKATNPSDLAHFRRQADPGDYSRF